jgi:hypothetical protein
MSFYQADREDVTGALEREVEAQADAARQTIQT